MPGGAGAREPKATPAKAAETTGAGTLSTATGVPAAAGTGRRGPASWPGRLAGTLAGWPPWAVALLAVLAWIAALAAVGRWSTGT